MKLLTIIPAYNEEAVIEKTVGATLGFFRSRPEFDFTLVVADSSDRDATRTIMRGLAQQNNDVEHHEFPDGSGKGEKIRGAALARPGYDIYSFIDADLPVTFSEFLTIIQGIEQQQANISIASKYIKGGGSNRPFHRILVSRMGNFFFNLFLRIPVRDFIAGAKAWDAEINRKIWPDVHDPSFFFDTELLYLAHKRGYSIVEKPVIYNDPRILGSKSGAVRLGAEFFKNTWELSKRQ